MALLPLGQGRWGSLIDRLTRLLKVQVLTSIISDFLIKILNEVDAFLAVTFDILVKAELKKFIYIFHTPSLINQ